MSDPVIAQRRGILGSAVAAKAQLYRSAADRSLLFYLQGLSMRNGGVHAIAEDLIREFPDRVDPSKVLIDRSEAYAAYLAGCSYDFNGRLAGSVADFLEPVCLDPALDIRQIATAKASNYAPYFRDPIGAILEHRRRQEEQESKSIVVTRLGSEVFSVLDRCLATRRGVTIEAKSGSGKTHPAEAWTRLHLGEARFVTLSGITQRTSFFQKLGAALGLGICQQASAKLQARVESVLSASGLMLVLDEAHFLWPQHRRSQSAPELVDWVNTMINAGIPIALICTDQFANLMDRARKTGWTSDQFIHRTHLYRRLDDVDLTRDDVLNVTRKMLSARYSLAEDEWQFDETAEPSPQAVKEIAGFAFAANLPLATARAIVDEAQFLARENDRDVVKLRDIAIALKTRQASDLSIRKNLAPAKTRGRERELAPLPLQEQTGRASARPLSLPIGARRSEQQMSDISVAPTNRIGAPAATAAS